MRWKTGRVISYVWIIRYKLSRFCQKYWCFMLRIPVLIRTIFSWHLASQVVAKLLWMLTEFVQLQDITFLMRHNKGLSDVAGHTNTDTNTNMVIPIYSKPIPIPILPSRIYTDTDNCFEIHIKPILIPIIGTYMYLY